MTTAWGRVSRIGRAVSVNPRKAGTGRRLQGRTQKATALKKKKLWEEILRKEHTRTVMQRCLNVVRDVRARADEGCLLDGQLFFSLRGVVSFAKEEGGVSPRI